MLKTKTNDYSLSHLNLEGVDIHVDANGGRVWDNDIKTTIVRVPNGSVKYVAVMHPHLFEPGQTVVVGKKNGTLQEDMVIKAIEGNILVFDRHFSAPSPAPSDMIALIHTYTSNFVDARAHEKAEKEKAKGLWI